MPSTEQRSRFFKWFSWPVLSGLLAGLLAAQWYLQQPQAPTPDTAVAPARTSYADAVARTAPAVVNIYTSKLVQRDTSPLQNDPLFRHFFGQPDMPIKERVLSSLGSGVIASADGYVLTNEHVIKGADEILVALFDGRETLARVIGSDPESDIAVLKISLDDLTAAPFGEATHLRVGDIVLAIGNPYGFGQTVTQGIVSALGRYGLNINTYENFIQTDAAINPGNSGGALIDVNGYLVGINSAIYSKTGGAQGIGLAIPVEVARKVMNDIVDHGHAVRGWLGVEARPLPRQLAAKLAQQNRYGLLISGVYIGGPAAQAGLHAGDILLSVNGESLHDGREGMNTVANLMPGVTVAVEVLRGESIITRHLTVGTRPAPVEAES
jgi:serine protease DegS